MKRGSLRKTKYWVIAFCLAVVTCIMGAGPASAQSYTATITSLGCPATSAPDTPIVCNPVIVTNIPTDKQAGMTYEWKTLVGPMMYEYGELREGSLTIPTYSNGDQPVDVSGPHALILTVSYPQVNISATLSENITITYSTSTNYTATITSLGCPDSAKPGTPFICTPVITTNIPAELQAGRTITWMGSDITGVANASWVDGTPSELVTNADSTLSFPTAGVKNILLTVTYPQAGASPIIVRRVTTMQVQISSVPRVSIQSLGCPYSALVKTSFSCTPTFTANMTETEKANLQFNWSADGLNEPGSTGTTFSMSFDTSGPKTLTLRITDPNGTIVERAADIKITFPPVTLKTMTCPTKVRTGAYFYCDPVLESSMSGADMDKLVYAWSGTPGFANKDGAFSFSVPGYQALQLTITHPDYPDLKIVRKATVNVISSSITIKYLGCPSQAVEFKDFYCSPTVVVDSITAAGNAGTIQYQWSVNGEVLSELKRLTATAFEPGSAAIGLKAWIVENAAQVATAEAAVNIPVVQRTTALGLTVSGPSTANPDSVITLAAKTSFPAAYAADMVRYTWTIDGQVSENTDSTIQIEVPKDRVAPITYSVKTNLNCCSAVPQETKSGQIAVRSYAFPAVSVKAPTNTVTNIVPYAASFSATAATTVALTYSWDFGDGSAAVSSPATTDSLGRSTTSVKHVYQSAGTYNVTLTATDPYGQSKQFKATAYTYTLPSRDLKISAVFSNEAMREPLTGYFKYVISGGLLVDSPVSTVWSVNGSPVSERATAPIVFPDGGTYTVSVQVKTKYGNTVTANQSVTVAQNQLPKCTVVVDRMDDGSAYGTYRLYASNCYDPDGKIIGYLWDLGDGRKGYSCTAYISPKAPGVYPYSLTVTDDSKQTITFGNSSIRVY